jgi:hypothetical protein
MATTKDLQSYLTLIQQYYTNIDSGNVDEILKLFSRYAKYNRTGAGLLVGFDAIRDFFTSKRKLVGIHSISKQRVEQVGQLNIVSTQGTFLGTNNNEPVRLGFKDFWHFPQNRPYANYRRSVIWKLPLKP